MNDNVMNKKEFRVVAARRTGHHAIIYWILKQSPGRNFFINDVTTNRNPFEFGCAYTSLLIPELERPYSRVKKELLIYCYESKLLNEVYNDFFKEKRAAFIGESQKEVDILIIRDPFNNFASKLQANRNRSVKGKIWAWGEENDFNARQHIELWKNHSKEYLNISSYMPNKIVINYNLWCKDLNYRKKIAQMLNIPFTDEGFNYVPHEGRGSSFNLEGYQDRANEMKLSTRWKHFLDDPYYLSLFDKEMIELFKLIWKKEDFPELYHADLIEKINFYERRNNA